MGLKTMLPVAIFLAMTVIVAPLPAQADDLADFKATVDQYIKSLANSDFEKFCTMEAEAAGLSGYIWHLQNHRTTDPNRRAKGFARFMTEYEYYEVIYTTLNAEVVGNTGVASGTLNLKSKHKEFPELTAKRRWSTTWVKQGGQWQLIFYHREFIDSPR
jgi:ketosteroid isomerase-like protein